MPDELGWGDEEIEEMGKGYVEWRNGPDKEKIDAALAAKRGKVDEGSGRSLAEARAYKDELLRNAWRQKMVYQKQLQAERRGKKPIDRKSDGK